MSESSVLYSQISATNRSEKQSLSDSREFKRKLSNSIQDLISLHPKHEPKNICHQRQLYLDILKWFESQHKILNDKLHHQFNNLETIQKQFELFMMCMEKLSQLDYDYCKQKGQLIKLLAVQQNGTFNLLRQYTDHAIKKAFRDQLQNELLLDGEYQQKIIDLEEEVKNLSLQKDKKWKNMFMLIKDNRIMRRQRGKLLRQLGQCYTKESKLEEKVSELIRENQRYKLLMNDGYYDSRDFEMWSKQLINMIKYEKTLKKYPMKAKKVLQFNLEALEISELKSIDEKIEYIIKAIQEADEIMEFYEDMNEVVLPSKLLLNNACQTEIYTSNKGINTIQKQFSNTYSQTKNTQTQNQIRTEVTFTYLPTPKLINYMSRYKKSPPSTNEFKTAGSEKSFKIIKQSKKNKLQFSNAFSCSFVYNYILAKDFAKGVFIQILERRLRNLQLSQENKFQFKYSGVSTKKNAMKTSKQLKNTIQHNNKSQSESVLDEEVLQFPEIENSGKKNFKQRLSHSQQLTKTKQKLRLSAMVNSKSRFSVTKSINLQGIHEIEEEKQNSDVGSKNRFEDYQGWETEKEKDEDNEIVNFGIANKFSETDKMSSVIQPPEIMLKNKISSNSGIKKNSGLKKSKLSSSVTNRSDGRSSSTFNIFGQNYIQSNHSQALNKLKTISSDKQIFFEQQNESSSKQNNNPLVSQIMKESNFANTSMNFTKNKKQLIKLANARSSAISPTMNRSKIKNFEEQKKQRNSVMTEKRDSIARSSEHGKEYFDTKIANKIISKKNKYKNNNTIVETTQVMEEEESQKNKKCIISYSSMLKYSKVRTQPNEPNLFESQKQIVGTHIDVLRTIQKIIHMLYVHRNELRFSQKTLKEFIDGNMKFLFGSNHQSQFLYFNKMVAIWKEAHPAVDSFRCMLSYDCPGIYLNDLLKLYVILLDKSGAQNLVVERSKALKIIQHTLSMFYQKQKYERVIQQLPYLNKTTVNLNDFFLSLNTLIKKDTIESEIYCYLRQILPGNQIDLNFSQIVELTKIFQGSLQLYEHLARLKFYCHRDSKSDSKVGMKIHKISLYTTLYGWQSFRNIISTIRETWNTLSIAEQQDNLYKSKKQIQFLKALKSTKKTKKFKCLIENQVLHKIQSPFLLKSQCPWLYRLAYDQIKNHIQYNTKVSDNFFMHLQIIEYYLSLRAIYPANLQSICEVSRKMVERQQIRKIIQNK